MTTDTYGPTSASLSNGSDLPSSSENKLAPKPPSDHRATSPRRAASNAFSKRLGKTLQRNLNGHGSPLYKLTWKTSVTSSGQVICRLRASGHRIFVNVCTGVLTDREGFPAAVLAAGWATPDTNNHRDGTKRRTPAPGRSEGTAHGASLHHMAVMAAGWLTPMTRGGKGPPAQPRLDRKEGLGGLDEQAATTLGPTSSGSTAPTAKRGLLNQELSRWLMGYPAEWGCCGATAMQSFRK